MHAEHCENRKVICFIALFGLVGFPKEPLQTCVFLYSLSLFFPSVFQQECPSGVVNEETFKQIYAQFFPHGGKWSALCLSGFLKP